jgi:hypothetical protein
MIHGRAIDIARLPASGYGKPDRGVFELTAPPTRLASGTMQNSEISAINERRSYANAMEVEGTIYLTRPACPQSGCRWST